MYGGAGPDRGRWAICRPVVSATFPRRRRIEMCAESRCAGTVPDPSFDESGTVGSQRNPDPEEPESPGVEAGIPDRVHPLPVIVEGRGWRTPGWGQRSVRRRRRRRPPTPRSGAGAPWRRMAMPTRAVRRAPIRGWRRRCLPARSTGPTRPAGSTGWWWSAGSTGPTRSPGWWSTRAGASGASGARPAGSAGGRRSVPAGAGTVASRLGDRGSRCESQGGYADPCGQRRAGDHRCRLHQSAPCLELPDAIATVINELGRELRCCCGVPARRPWASPIRELRTAGRVGAAGDAVFVRPHRRTPANLARPE